MYELHILNIKCNGCKNTITKELESLGASDVSIDITSGTIYLEYKKDISLVTQALLSLGYPEVNSKEAKSLLKKAKSYVSCALGKLS